MPAVLVFVLGLPWAAAAQDAAMREAARLDAEQKCPEAERYYRQALAKGSPSPALLNNLGNHYLVCGQPELARTYFERLLAIHPAHPNANLQLARIAASNRQGAKALEYLARVKEPDPNVSLLRAEALHWAGRRAEAEKMLAGVEKQANGDARTLFLLGLTYARIGAYDRAEAAFNAVLREHPADFDLLFNLGRAAARAHHYDRAQSALEVALKVRPDDPEALLELGLVWVARRDFTRAAYVLARARQKAPKRPEILLALARAAEDAGYYGDSALAYDEYLALRPREDAVRRDRGRVCAYTDARRDEGLKELAWYSRKHPDDAVGHYYLAQFSWRSDPQQALDQLSKAVKLNPGYAAARFSRAWLLHRLGRTAESIPDLQAVVRTDPKNVRALDQLGLANLSLDQAAEAERTLRRALALAPEDPEVLMHLGRALMALGREDEAEQFLEKYRKVRPQRVRDPRKEPWMIESAGLSVAERTEREIARLRRDARDHPGDAELQFHLAALLLMEGKSEEAAAEFRTLLAMNGDSRVWEEAGKALVRAGQYALARQFLERAADRPGTRLDLAITLFHTEGPDQALTAIENVPEGERAGDYLLMKARILDAAGKRAEAEQALREGLWRATSRPEVLQEAAFLLVRHDRKPEALEVLARAIGSNTGDPDLLLARAVVLALMDRTPGAEKALRELESRWPEWYRPYLVHGLLLEQSARKTEAARKLRTAVALGPQDPAAGCALARISGAAPTPPCACLNGLYQSLFPSCGPGLVAR